MEELLSLRYAHNTLAAGKARPNLPESAKDIIQTKKKRIVVRPTSIAVHPGFGEQSDVSRE